jgi:hypothetical protein
LDEQSNLILWLNKNPQVNPKMTRCIKNYKKYGFLKNKCIGFRLDMRDYAEHNANTTYQSISYDYDQSIIMHQDSKSPWTMA